jgi:hypothetical protein
VPTLESRAIIRRNPASEEALNNSGLRHLGKWPSLSASDAETPKVCVPNLHMHTFLMARGNQTTGLVDSGRRCIDARWALVLPFDPVGEVWL